MFWHQNQGSSIWGSRDIKMTKKFFFVFRNQEVMKRGEMQKKISIYRTSSERQSKTEW